MQKENVQNDGYFQTERVIVSKCQTTQFAIQQQIVGRYFNYTFGCWIIVGNVWYLKTIFIIYNLLLTDYILEITDITVTGYYLLENNSPMRMSD